MPPRLPAGLASTAPQYASILTCPAPRQTTSAAAAAASGDSAQDGARQLAQAQQTIERLREQLSSAEAAATAEVQVSRARHLSAAVSGDDTHGASIRCRWITGGGGACSCGRACRAALPAGRPCGSAGGGGFAAREGRRAGALPGAGAIQQDTLLRRRARHLPVTVAGVDTHGASIMSLCLALASLARCREQLAEALQAQATKAQTAEKTDVERRRRRRQQQQQEKAEAEAEALRAKVGRLEALLQRMVSAFLLAWIRSPCLRQWIIRSPCLRQCVHGASIGGGEGEPLR
jgi:chemotaxis protein histidine kinase CheA